MKALIQCLCPRPKVADYFGAKLCEFCAREFLDLVAEQARIRRLRRESIKGGEK